MRFDKRRCLQTYFKFQTMVTLPVWGQLCLIALVASAAPLTPAAAGGLKVGAAFTAPHSTGGRALPSLASGAPPIDESSSGGARQWLVTASAGRVAALVEELGGLAHVALVPPSGFVAWCSRSQAAALSLDPLVVSVAPIEAGHKVDAAPYTPTPLRWLRL